MLTKINNFVSSTSFCSAKKLDSNKNKNYNSKIAANSALGADRFEKKISFSGVKMNQEERVQIINEKINEILTSHICEPEYSRTLIKNMPEFPFTYLKKFYDSSNVVRKEFIIRPNNSIGNAELFDKNRELIASVQTKVSMREPKLYVNKNFHDANGNNHELYSISLKDFSIQREEIK